MLEANIRFEGGKVHSIEASNLETLKNKCKPFIEDEKVYDIVVLEKKVLGWIKSDIAAELL